MSPDPIEIERGGTPENEGTPPIVKYEYVDLTHRIPISRNSSYFSATGKRLPGVTTVISKNLGWNKQALINWANECGLEGKRHYEVRPLKPGPVLSVMR